MSLASRSGNAREDGRSDIALDARSGAIEREGFSCRKDVLSLRLPVSTIVTTAGWSGANKAVEGGHDCRTDKRR
jgi:hypothetical protein